MKRHLDETGSALLAAAHQLLAVAGPEALTVRRIATEAGMSTMNVYSRFGGKDGVIDELYWDGYARLAEAIDAVPTGDDVVDEITRIAHTYRAFAIANPAYYRIMFRTITMGFSPSPESTEFAMKTLETFVERVTRGYEQGALALPDGSGPAEAAVWVWATCHGMVSLELDGVADEIVSWASIYEIGVRSMLATLRPVAAGRTGQSR